MIYFQHMECQNKQQNTQCKKIYFGIPYVGNKSQVYARKVREYVKPIPNVKLQVFYKRGLNLIERLKIRKQRPARKCVYKIPCQNCTKCYIGETGRLLSTRIYEHEHSLRSAKTALAEHVRNTQHKIDFSKISVLSNEKYDFRRKILEALFMRKNDTFDNNSSSVLLHLW